MSEKVLISACLVGELCRYDAQIKKNHVLLDALNMEGCEYIAICPETLSGLSTPRNASQIQCGDGYDVLSGKAKVIDVAGNDITKNFIIGAKMALDIALKNAIKRAILKERSPSCGANCIYNNDKLVKGAGVATALLVKNGIAVISDEKFSCFRQE